jgi:hypothetical protein
MSVSSALKTRLKHSTSGNGWLVALIGVRVSLTAAALPMIFVGPLLKLLGSGRVAGAGAALADAFVIWRLAFVGQVLLTLTLWAFFRMKQNGASDALARVGGLNRSMQHFILEGKDGVRNGTKVS